MSFMSNKISEEGITQGNYWPCEVNGPFPCLGLWNLLASHPSILENAYIRIINVWESWEKSAVGIKKIQKGYKVYI